MSINLVIIFTSLSIAQTAKILLVTPTPSISHQFVFRPVVQELIKLEHEVIFITPDPVYRPGESPKNLIEIDVHDLSYTLWQKVCDTLEKKNLCDLVSIMNITFRVIFEIFQHQMRETSVLRLITNNTIKFDLLILEECCPSSLIFSHIFKAPVILMSSFGDTTGNINVLGGPTHPLLYPCLYTPRVFNPTIWKKISEIYSYMSFNQMYVNLEKDTDKFLKSYIGSDTPRMNDLQNNINMLFLNTHQIWSHNQPVPPNVLQTWGIHKTPENKLPKDLQSYLDSSENGVIYISFGTNFKTSSMHPVTRKILLSVFSRLPFNILWKWDSDELPGKSENIKISKWFPQCDVLRHRNVKLFITHGGLQSTDEAINAGVPLIGIPVFGDQHYNTENYLYFKIGLKLQNQSLTIENLESAIKAIFVDYDRYRKNIIHLRTQMLDQLKPALGSTIWWIEYIIRHGGARHLRAPAANMSWTVYYELELVFMLFGGLLIITFIMLFIIYNCFKYVNSKLRGIRCAFISAIGNHIY